MREQLELSLGLVEIGGAFIILFVLPPLRGKVPGVSGDPVGGSGVPRLYVPVVRILMRS